MTAVDVRDIPNLLDELMSRIQQGEEIDIELSGQLIAKLVPVEQIRWKTWDEIAHIFNGPPDSDWERDIDRFDQTPVNPRERPRTTD